ncbi:MAG: hypothetical protein WB624_24000, partial [Xanthobacteraceae bacterium]
VDASCSVNANSAFTAQSPAAAVAGRAACPECRLPCHGQHPFSGISRSKKHRVPMSPRVLLPDRNSSVEVNPVTGNTGATPAEKRSDFTFAFM